MNIKPVIQLNAIEKKSKDKLIIDKLSLSIYPGQIVALLGGNGAGKTTLMRLMVGLEKPCKGTVLLNNLSPSHPKARGNIGVVPQVSQFIEELTIKEKIQWISKHYSNKYSLRFIIDNFLLSNLINKKIVYLSEGEKRRLSLALAFIGKPKIIFLDEPTVGLDNESREFFWKFLKNYHKSDISIVLTTHYFEEAKALANTMFFIDNGKIVNVGMHSM